MKVTVPWLKDGALVGADGGQYRVRNNVAHIKPEDWPAWEPTHQVVTSPHPMNPDRLISRRISPTVLDMDTDPIYDDDPDDYGDYSHPDDQVNVGEVHARLSALEGGP